MEILYKLTRTFHLKYSTRNSCAVRKRSYCMIYSDLTFKRIPLLSVTFSYIDDYRRQGLLSVHCKVNIITSFFSHSANASRS